MNSKPVSCIQGVYTHPVKKDVTARNKCDKECIQNGGQISMSEQGKVISFRVSETELLDLESQAETAQMTVQQFAKKALQEKVGGETKNLGLSVSALKEELLELRQDVAVSVEAILVTSGKVSSEQALKFVTEKLRKRV